MYIGCFHICLYSVTNWNRKCFWTSVVYILQNGIYICCVCQNEWI